VVVASESVLHLLLDPLEDVLLLLFRYCPPLSGEFLVFLPLSARKAGAARSGGRLLEALPGDGSVGYHDLASPEGRMWINLKCRV
jgi:hypothetical protein